jgi:hypothetical protein
VDAASTEVVRVAGPDRATPADNDEAYISFNLEDSAAFDEFARISAVATDVTTTEEDGALTFDIVVAGGDAEAMRLVSDGTDGTQLILPSANDPVLPTLAFGDADSGLYEYTEDGISFAFSGAEVWAFNALSLGASTTACDVGGECVWLDTEVSTSTNPSIGPSVVDGETGIGWAGTGTLSMVLDAEEFARFSDPGDAASGEVFRLNGPDRTTPADDDEFHVSFNLEDSAAFDEFGRISAVALDVTTTEEDGALTFDVVAGATDTEVMRLAAAGTGQIVQLLVPAQNQEATPSIAFDDGDSGIYESQTDVLSVSLNGSQAWDFQGVGFYGVVSGSPGIQNEDATATNPTLLP